MNGGETPVDSVSRQRSRRVGGNAPDGGDGAGAAVGDVRSVPISSVEPKVQPRSSFVLKNCPSTPTPSKSIAIPSSNPPSPDATPLGTSSQRELPF